LKWKFKKLKNLRSKSLR